MGGIATNNVRLTEGGLAGAPPSPDFSPTAPMWSGSAPLGRRHDDPPAHELSEGLLWGKVHTGHIQCYPFPGTSCARQA